MVSFDKVLTDCSVLSLEIEATSLAGVAVVKLGSMRKFAIPFNPFVFAKRSQVFFSEDHFIFFRICAFE